MDAEPGEGWSDVVSKILRMGTNNPESNRILSKAKKEDHDRDSNAEESNSEAESEDDEKRAIKDKSNYTTVRLKPRAQPDAMQDNDLKAIATRGVVHLFNAVKTVNPKSDKLKKKKKKKKKKVKQGKRSIKRKGANGGRLKR